VEQKTHEQWRVLEEELRRLLKEVEGRTGEQQREQLRLTKHLQDLAVGEQEVGKRLAAQRTIAAEVEAEGATLHKYWRRAYLEAEARVGAAAAEVEAEERARSHLVGHGDRIRAKLEGATGNLTAQMTVIEEQGRMDAQLRDQTEALERRVRELQMDIDERERQKAELERQRDEVQSACQDKASGPRPCMRNICDEAACEEAKRFECSSCSFVR
jgi:chromosome segregation ATPase